MARTLVEYEIARIKDLIGPDLPEDIDALRFLCTILDIPNCLPVTDRAEIELIELGFVYSE